MSYIVTLSMAPSLSLNSVSATFIDSLDREGEEEAPGPAGMIELMPKSPGISKNQNLKDQVLQDVFNRKIRDLKRMQIDAQIECS